MVPPIIAQDLTQSEFLSGVPEPNPSYRIYVRSKCIVFHKTKDAFGGLSNMAGGFPLEVNGVKIFTAEALYQACRFPHLPDIQKIIIGQHSPMTAKMKGKPFRNQTRADWNLLRTKIMRWCLRVKLAQHYEVFGDLLLQTGDLPIVEQSSKDDFWGAKIQYDDVLIGENILGRLLMQLRERLLHENNNELLTVAPLPIQDFLLLGRPIDQLTQTPTSKSIIPTQSSLL